MNRLLSRRLSLMFSGCLLLLGTTCDGLVAQDEYRSADVVIRRAPCWTTTMEFYDRQAFPYYSVQGYFFDANPFQTTRMMDGNTSMIMRSMKGYSLLDVTGGYRWTDARIRVDCYVRELLFGLMSQYYATVRYELGRVEPVSTACESVPEDPWGGDGGEYITEIGSAAYDPYDPEQTLASDCSGESAGASGGENEGMTCWQEYMVIEISYDGGITWQEFWSGWGTVCEQNQS